MLRILKVYSFPEPTFSIPDPDPGLTVSRIPDLHQRISILLTKKTDTEFSKIRSGMFISDPVIRIMGLDFFPSPPDPQG
jgi:hypothetical protein